MRAELDKIDADEAAPHIKVTHTLTRATKDVAAENVYRGRVNIEMLRYVQGWPDPGEETLIYMCGPKGFL